MFLKVHTFVLHASKSHLSLEAMTGTTPLAASDFVIFGGGPEVGAARALKADLLAARAAGERSFVASNILRSAAAMERTDPQP